MDTDGLPGAQGRHRAGKRARRRARGIQVSERDGYWHATGRIRIEGRSIRIRRSLGLSVKAFTAEQAETERDAIVADLKAKTTGGSGRGDPLSVAADGYLNRPREHPLGATTVNIVKAIALRFGRRRLNEIDESEWKEWIDGKRTEAGFAPGCMSGRAAASRERFLNGVLSFLSYCASEHGLAKLPKFQRDKKARNPNRRARRRIGELRPDLIATLLEHAHITLRAQLAVELTTGARVSSVLHAARVCDLIIGQKRSQITFPRTKNGEDVTAILDDFAVTILKDYLTWRGRLHEREAPLFLTWRRRPYADPEGTYGGQNKTAFNAAKRRAGKAIMERGRATAQALRRQGRHKAAAAALASAQADAELIGKVTQHWFRHRLATRWLRRDPRATMEQGGWLDIRSVMGYSHDVPEYRAQVAQELDELATFWTRGRSVTAKKGR